MIIKRPKLYPSIHPSIFTGVCWSLSQQSKGEGMVTPWTQFVTGPKTLSNIYELNLKTHPQCFIFNLPADLHTQSVRDPAKIQKAPDGTRPGRPPSSSSLTSHHKRATYTIAAAPGVCNRQEPVCWCVSVCVLQCLLACMHEQFRVWVVVVG